MNICVCVVVRSVELLSPTVKSPLSRLISVFASVIGIHPFARWLVYPRNSSIWSLFQAPPTATLIFHLDLDFWEPSLVRSLIFGCCIPEKIYHIKVLCPAKAVLSLFSLHHIRFNIINAILPDQVP